MRSIPLVVAGALAGFAALALLVLALLPYGTLEALADGLMRDGDFETLKEANALVFRLLLGGAGLGLLWAAFVTLSGRLVGVRDWLRRYLSDLVQFWRALRPEAGEGPFLAALILVLGVGLVFRLADLNGVMTHDESYTFVEFSSGSLFNLLTNYHLPNNHILNSLLIHISTRLFGIQPWAVRLPALLAGLLLIPAAYAFARRAYDRYTALTAALLVAVLPGAILYSTTGRGYSLVALFTLLSLWLADFLRSANNRFAWSLLVLFSALGFYSVPVFLFPFGMVFAWMFFETLAAPPGEYGSKIGFLKRWLAAGLATAVLVLLLYAPVFIYTGAEKVFANHWVTPESWVGYLPSLPGHLLAAWEEWTGGASPAWSWAVGVGFLLGLAFHRRVSRLRFPLQAAAFLWLAALMLVQRPIGVSKIWVFLQAPAMIWCAAGLVGIWREIRLGSKRRLALAAVLSGLALLAGLAGAVRLLPGLPARWAETGPVENTVLALQPQLESLDRIVIDAPFDAALWYYSRLHDLGADRFNLKQDFDRLFVVVSSSDGQTLESVLANRGPDPGSYDLGAARLVTNSQNLDTYLVPGR